MLRAMAAAPPYLPVIKTITLPNGSAFSPVGELRIMSSLVATVVTGDGPDRIELSVYAAPVTTYPAIPPVVQPPVAQGQSGAATGCVLAFASLDGSSHFTGAQLFADGSLTASDTNYVTWSLWDANEDGSHNGGALATGTTKLTSPGSGTWAAGHLVIDVGWSGDIATDHRLVVEWDTVTNGTPPAMPGGTWRVK